MWEEKRQSCSLAQRSTSQNQQSSRRWRRRYCCTSLGRVSNRQGSTAHTRNTGLETRGPAPRWHSQHTKYPRCTAPCKHPRSTRLASNRSPCSLMQSGRDRVGDRSLHRLLHSFVSLEENGSVRIVSRILAWVVWWPGWVVMCTQLRWNTRRSLSLSLARTYLRRSTTHIPPHTSKAVGSWNKQDQAQG
jgi:hypothetical protein